MNTNTPAWSIVAGVRAAQAAFPPSPDDTPYDRAKRATTAIAEAGLALRESMMHKSSMVSSCLACRGIDGRHNPGCAAAEFDAAVRAACGEGV